MAESERKSSAALLLISWVFVGVPAAWGVSQTVIKSLALFSPPEAAKPAEAPKAAPPASLSPAPGTSPVSGTTAPR